jgi:predicted transcriptional regulator
MTTDEPGRSLDWLALSPREQDRHIREGVADAEAGRTIHHDEVRKWAREMVVRAYCSPNQISDSNDP